MEPGLSTDEQAFFERPSMLWTTPAMVRRARHLSTTFLLAVGSTDHVVSIVEGEVRSIRRGPFVSPSWQFALRAPAEEWAEFWSASPAPGHHDIMAMRKRKVLAMEGNLHPLMANLRYFKELLASAREVHGG